MKWTSKSPTEPGFYWFGEFKDSIPKVVEVYDNGDGLYIAGYCLIESVYETAVWSAKLEEPK